MTRIRALAAMAALALPVVLAASTAPAAAAAPAGAFAEAYGLLVDATVLEGNVPVVVGPLAPVASSCSPGGSSLDELLAVPASPVADVGVLNTGAGTACAADPNALASAMTSAAEVLQAVQALTIRTDEITSTAGVTCTSAPTASTEIVNLSVGGSVVPLPADIPPNFDLLPEVFGPLGIRVILNEQHPAVSGRGIVVNGLHVIAAGTGALPVGGGVLRGDIIISHASAGVLCPGGPGSDLGGLPAPDIAFTKTATPASIKAGDTVTYTATVQNTSATPCEVLKFIDHVAPPFTLVSSDGDFGSVLDDPAPVRTDGGVDAVLRPTDLVIAAGSSATQTFVVQAKDDAAVGTYYDSLEIYCGLNGNFVSGPLAPVTITAVVPPRVPQAAPTPAAPVAPGPELPRTGGAPLITALALVLLTGGLGVRRLRSYS